MPTAAGTKESSALFTAAAAFELQQVVGPKKGKEPRVVAGPLPVKPSSTGRAYYCLLEHHEFGPCVAAGQTTAVRLLKGSWVANPPAPEGFATLDSALNELSVRCPDQDNFIVYLK